MRVTRLFSILPSPYRQSLKWLASALVAFTAAGAIGWVWAPFGQLALAAVAGVGLAGFGIVLIASAAAEAWRERSRPLTAIGAGLTPLLAVAAGFAAALPCIWLGNDLSTWGWLLAHRGTYLEIARKLGTGEIGDGNGEEQEALGTRFTVEPGSKSQIAFPLFGGFIDGWQGIVHDPAGVVMKANDGRPPGGGLGEVEMMFGGQMVWCRHMTGPFYRCSFT